MYQELASQFHYTPHQISEMNPFQWQYLLDAKLNEMGDDTIHFRTMDEYLKWKARKGL